MKSLNTTTPTGTGANGLVALQNLVFPDISICTEQDLYLRTNNRCTIAPESGEVHFTAGGTLDTSTYFNALNIGKWNSACHLDGLFLRLEGGGKYEVRVWLARPGRSWDVIFWQILDLPPASPFLADISACLQGGGEGMLFYTLRALGAGILTGSAFLTRVPVAHEWPRMAICVTTFARERQIRHTARRLQAHLTTSPLGEFSHLFVVNNGQPVTLPTAPHVTQLANPNLGGAGGFARALIEARKRGFKLCLFMDDDAAMHMESIHRAHVFLALARDPETALAGAMITNDDKWRMWENGAIFDHRCIPQFQGTDLRDFAQVFEMEQTPTPPRQRGLYGGWWFFAFPVDHASHHPFPFFVRGDDVSFSLANRFAIHSLNGVASFQDSFAGKESPLVWYLDLRSHMVHHLALANMRSGAFGIAAIAWWFLFRNLLKFHYESAASVLLAWADVMQGPEFFARNPGAGQRRLEIAALTRQERWRRITRGDLPERHRFDVGDRSWRQHLFRLTANGHLLPFFARWGNRVVIGASRRWDMRPVWGACEIRVVNDAQSGEYRVRQSKARFFGILLRGLLLNIRFVMRYRRLLASYRHAYPRLTSARFWEDALDLDRAKAGEARPTTCHEKAKTPQ